MQTNESRRNQSFSVSQKVPLTFPTTIRSCTILFSNLTMIMRDKGRFNPFTKKGLGSTKDWEMLSEINHRGIPPDQDKGNQTINIRSWKHHLKEDSTYTDERARLLHLLSLDRRQFAMRRLRKQSHTGATAIFLQPQSQQWEHLPKIQH